MKNTILSFITAAILLGCGGSDSSSESEESFTDVVVERGPVIGAYVVDNNGKKAYNLGNGNYRFQNTPAYPINAYGGYIDVNRDGLIDANDTQMSISLSLNEVNRKKLTILTTLSKEETIKNEILLQYNLSSEELFTLTPSESLSVAAISDVVFKYCTENNSTLQEMNLSVFQTLQTDIEILIATNNSSSENIIDIVTQNEIDLVNDLNITLEDENVTAIANEIINSSEQTQDPSSLVNSFPISELSEEQKEDLIFMYQEEKVARDVYLAMYDMWNLQIFSNIAKAEQSHMDAVKALLVKYDLEIPVVSDTRGEFELDELQSLYNTLMISASVSSNEALKVGKLIEETDIADLEERIVDAPEDIKIVYQNLLSGSYSHLNAFTKQIR